jgi:hypothetical protein
MLTRVDGARRKSGVTDVTADDHPTINNPPRGELWDDQDDIGGQKRDDHKLIKMSVFWTACLSVVQANRHMVRTWAVKLRKGQVGIVQDYAKHLEKLRTDAAECRLICDLATEPAKRELFDRLAVHLNSLADQVELAMLEASKRPKS